MLKKSEARGDDALKPRTKKKRKKETVLLKSFLHELSKGFYASGRSELELEKKTASHTVERGIVGDDG